MLSLNLVYLYMFITSYYVIFSNLNTYIYEIYITGMKFMSAIVATVSRIRAKDI